jgi:hypothetical protein
MTRLMAWPASGKKAVGLQESDLLVQQVTLDQRCREPGLQPVARQFFAAARPVLRAASAAARKASYQSVSRRRCNAELARNGLRGLAAQQPEVTSVKVVEKRVSEEVAIGQAAMGGSLAGSASISGGASSAMPSICM